MERYLKEGLAVGMSDHGMKRMEERVGLASFAEQADRVWAALCYGKRPEECDGYLRSCIEHYRRSWHEKMGRELRYYKGMIYVFQGNTLVTTFPPREEVRKKAAQKCERRRIAKMRRQIQSDSGNDDVA